ncbi:MAG: NAD-dependent epimerase/dehydratase family protein [Spirochaetaceae bacterium]|nr:MAG: NAD-dependent epimerase/dehydratase family protein [Spirochaetaceae bacterium]
MHDGKGILVTGGSGLLGGEFKKLLPAAVFPDMDEFNITNPAQMEDYLSRGRFTLILHAAAFTSPPRVDADPVQALDVNIAGTVNVVKAAIRHKLKLVYICTDYVFRGDAGNYREDDPVFPVNKYAWSKLGGECAVRLYVNSLIIRTTFGPVPFPYEKAFTDQWTSRESVVTVSRMIVALLDRNVTGVVHVGGKRKSVHEYAASLDSSRTIGKLSIKDVAFSVPVDTSLDCTRFKRIMEGEEKK